MSTVRSGPKADLWERPLSTRSGQSIFSIAVIRADYSIIRLQTSPDLPHEKERLVAAWARGGACLALVLRIDCSVNLSFFPYSTTQHERFRTWQTSEELSAGDNSPLSNYYH
ncbi:MAG: hypothetical protein OES26_27550, partial [Gammaproteobacteria bacterium]|nr:hypothetical protein [Gammaproteobacteria bacterium]